ncbi:DUF1002 domain-containing protein [Pontibacillus litoralis]|uniref:DUF1002 domain-containing protein n=1 Tax=Pontibacillus litoralis JSM 072002 TaxID=1385512 RepID=A0A0A5G155_9BACI|nr:DUF1002 domain-containing protein [Pontibacillus litoralis]KGX85774.1 hypothetical protein N784_08185 [Pontibacillus litoralis JSM 072002]
MLKRITFLVMALTMMIGITGNQSTFASSGNTEPEVINEKLGVPTIVYGDTLTETQEAEVRELLNVQDQNNVDELRVDGQDIAKYIDGNPNSRMYSSVKITPRDKGEGLGVVIVTPDNITEVTEEMYANALLTAGVENALVEVASPLKVTGHSALTGIYKAFDEKGIQLDQNRMKVANEELDVATDLSQNSELTPEQVSQLITEIKKEISEQAPTSREEIEQIIHVTIENLNVNLNAEEINMLTDLFDQMRDLNIDFSNVEEQLNDIASSVKDVLNDEGFWNNVENFFKNIIDAILDIFQSIINSIREMFA